MRKISSGARTDASRRDTTNDFVAAPPVPAAQTAADPLPSPSSSTPTGLAAASHDAPLTTKGLTSASGAAASVTTTAKASSSTPGNKAAASAGANNAQSLDAVANLIVEMGRLQGELNAITIDRDWRHGAARG